MATYCCNNCLEPLHLHRFKCLSCRDFDLCEKCNSLKNLVIPDSHHEHSSHCVIKLSDCNAAMQFNKCALLDGDIDDGISQHLHSNIFIAASAILDALEVFGLGENSYLSLNTSYIH